MISKKKVEHIAKLARLGLTEAEIKKFQGELSSILGYVEKLKKVDVSKIKATSHPCQVQNIMRTDEAEDEDVEVRKKLVAASPDKEKGYIKVKSVFK